MSDPFQSFDPRPRARRVTGLAVALALVLLALAAATVWLRTATAVEAAEARQDQAALRFERFFEAVELLTDAEVAALRRSLNARHVALAKALGVPPPATRAARDSVAAGLVDLSGHPAVVVAEARFSAAALTPDAAASLDSLLAAFQGATRRAGLPAVRPRVTSVFRSAEDQGGLRAVNTNAAGGTSSHEYATTYDLSYRRFAAVVPASPPVTWTRWTPRPLRAGAEAVLDARWADRIDRLVASYPSRYDALLGRALIGLEDRGVLVVVRERQQPVYHVTVARRLAVPSLDDEPTAPAAP